MHDHYDVIVCGAGPAGVTASLAAARRGARTLLVDEDANPGGAHIDHFILALCGEPFEGLTKEICDDLAAIDSSFARGWPHTFDVHNYLVVVRRKLREAGVAFLPHTRVHGTVTDGERVIGIKFTRPNAAAQDEAIVTGKVIVDSTGNGDVSFFSGVPYRFGREARSEFNESFAPESADRCVQQITWMYLVAKTRETDHKPSHAHYDDGRYLIWGGGFDCPDPTDPAALEATQDEAWRLFPSRKLREHILAGADYIVWQKPVGSVVSYDDPTLAIAYDITGNPDYAACALELLSLCPKHGIAGVNPDCLYRTNAYFTPARSGKPGAQEMVLNLAKVELYGYLPRLMRPVIQALAADPDGFLEHARDWRERRRRMTDTVSGPQPGQKPGMRRGVLSTESFAE